MSASPRVARPDRPAEPPLAVPAGPPLAVPAGPPLAVPAGGRPEATA